MSGSVAHHRREERAELTRLFKTGASAQMLAPRRIGKTWLMHKVADDLEAEGWLCVRLDVEGMRTEEEFLRALCREIEKNQAVFQKISTHLLQRLQQLTGGTFSGTLVQTIGHIDPKQFVETLVESLNNNDQRTLILIDEISLFVMERAKVDADDTRALLYHLRKLRQSYKKVVWLLTGSVGLDVVSRRFDLAGAQIGLDTFVLETFTTEAARSYVEELSDQQQLREALDFAPGAFELLVQELGWLSPYYLMHLARLIRPSEPAVGSKRAIAGEPDVARAFAELLKPPYRTHFVAWEEHIKKNFPKQQSDQLHAILNILCENVQGETEATLLVRFAEFLPDGPEAGIDEPLDQSRQRRLSRRVRATLALPIRTSASLLGEVHQGMTILPGIAIYNQARQRDEDFIENFVARRELLALLLNVLRKMARGVESEHQIIVGQRGMGKSSLLRRIALGIRYNEELSARFSPLQFREEQYNVNTLDVFWRNCGESLAQWCEDNDRHVLAARLDEAIESQAWRDPETAANVFLDLCKEVGRRAVLLVDNLDLIVDALKPGEQWALRRVLQMPQGPILIGAATHFLTQSGDRDAAFYEFFHPHVLEPLSEVELMRCMRALADRRKDAGEPVLQILAREPERLRALYDLTGGNPRVLALIYQLLERRETGDVFADLEALLDQVSPYYKARVEEYATAQQRSVIDAIALNWDPITSHNLSVETGIELTTIPSHLSRLKKDGFVEEVQTSGARSGYQIAERFLNIWYLMRHGTRRARQNLRWLSICLSKLYGTEELSRMAAAARNEAFSFAWHPNYREAVISAYEEFGTVALAPGAALGHQTPTTTRPSKEANEARIGNLATDIGQNDELSRLSSTIEKATEIDGRGDFQGLAKALDHLFADGDAPNEPALRQGVARALVNKGFRLGVLGRTEEAVATYDEVVRRFGASDEPALREQVARALFNKGFRLGVLGRTEEAVATYDEVVRRFGASDEPALREGVARALVNKGVDLGALGRTEEAVATYDEVVRRFGASDEPALRKQVARALVNKGVDLGALGRTEEAVATYDEVVRRFGASDEPALRKQVARALVNKGFRLGVLGRTEEAVATYDEVVRRFGASDEPALREQVARALVNKGFDLGALGRTEEAVATYDEVVRRFGASDEPALREQVARALVNKGFDLSALGRTEEAVATYDEVVRRFGASDEPALREQVARALFNKGVDLGALGRTEEAVATYDEVVRRFGASDEPALREQVARALVNKGFDLSALGRTEEAVATYDEVVRRFGASDEPALREQVARALFNKGVDLGALGRTEEAVATYDEVVRRFGASDEPALREQVARALVNKGFDLSALGRTEEAVATYDEVVRRFGASDEPALRQGVARALVNKGFRLGVLGRTEEAVATYDEVVRRFGASDEPALRQGVARALVNKGFRLGVLGRTEEAVATYDEVVRRFGASDEPALREQVARALVNKGFDLSALGRTEEAVATYDEVVRRFGASDEPALREQVARALFNKGVDLSALGRTEEAVATYDEVVRRFGASDEPALREQVARALFNKGVDLSALGRTEEAVATFDEVARRYGSSGEPSLRRCAYEALCQEGYLLFDELGSLESAEMAYRRALQVDGVPVLAKSNLAWLLLTTARIEEARNLRAELTEGPPAGLTFLDAGLELAGDNFGSATNCLATILGAGPNHIEVGFHDGLARFLRLVQARGYGDKLISWFETSGNADKYAPIHAAFVAYIRGEKHLLDVNPEVRRPARDILNKLTAPRRNTLSSEPPTKQKTTRRAGRKSRS